MQQSSAITAQQPPPGGELPLPVQVDPSRATPVYGTAEPASGLPAEIRRQAYRRPTHDPLHWLLLLAADRVDSMENLGREAATPGEQGLVARQIARQARANPKAYVAAAAGAIAGLVAWRVLRR